MPICTKCRIDKPIEDYSTETRKSTGKTYYKKYCKVCFRLQAIEWKKRNPTKSGYKKQSQPKPVKYKEVEGFRNCVDCKITKPIIDYYKSERIRCKQCSNKRRQECKWRASDGTKYQILTKPNTYSHPEQKIELFNLMEKIGWVFENGIWNKPGLKEKGIWHKVILDPPKIKNPNRTGGIQRLFFGEIIQDIINLRIDGKNFYEIADIYSCSHTTIRRVVKEYYEKQETD